MNQIVRIVLAILLLDLGLIAYFIVLSALFPHRVLQAQAALDRLPGRSFVLGLVNFIFFAALAFVFFLLANKTDGLLKIILILPGLVLTAFLLTALSIGLAAEVNLLGERIFPARSSWQRAATGTLLLGVASAVPFAGWFLLFPYSGLSAVGAFILTFFQKEPLP